MATEAPRGDLRLIFTDGAGLAAPTMQREIGPEVWAIIGPVGKHTSHPELQDALGLVCMAFNRRHGRLRKAKHLKLAKERGMRGGADLLREALAAVPEGES
jgi:hypothetical protein